RSSPQGLAAVNQDDAERRRPAIDAPVKTRAALVSAVATGVADSHVEAGVRQEALAVARLLRRGRYDKLPAEVADQAELEGTPLLAAVEAEIRRQRGLEN